MHVYLVESMFLDSIYMPVTLLCIFGHRKVKFKTKINRIHNNHAKCKTNLYSYFFAKFCTKY